MAVEDIFAERFLLGQIPRNIKDIKVILKLVLRTCRFKSNRVISFTSVTVRYEGYMLVTGYCTVTQKLTSRYTLFSVICLLIMCILLMLLGQNGIVTCPFPSPLKVYYLK